MDISGEVLKVAQQYLKQVRRTGPDDIMAICPFHVKPDGSEERKGSFAISLSKGLWFCHSCHSKGNLFTFFRTLGVSRHHIELQYRYLIDEAANNLPPSPDPLKAKVWELMPVDEGVLGLFEYCPVQLLSDGFEERTLYNFDVGFDQWNQRITYPLRDLKGTLVGISGRATSPHQETRYKVYTNEYKLWRMPARNMPDKRCMLWNAHAVYPEAYHSNPGETTVVVVEGFKAAMWLWQAGVTNVVALLGSYLSWEQSWILERIGATVVFFLDNDYPGRSGTIKAAELLSRSLNVRVVEYPDRLLDDDEAQPDNCTPYEVKEVVEAAPPYLNWLLKQVL